MTHHRFHTLDALRGVAALAVLAFHWHFLMSRQFFPHGTLAVDFFFMLSGFVLSMAYQKQLDNGWSTSSFMKARLIRFYPIYLLGLALGFALAWRMPRALEGTPSRSILLLLLLLGVFFLPAPSQITVRWSFPYNGATWSLFIELIANLFHAVILRRRSIRFLATVAVISSLVFIGLSMKLGIVAAGGSDTRIYLGVPRVLSSYVIGVLLFRLWSEREKRGERCWTVSPVLLGALLAGLLAVPVGGRMASVYEFFVIFCVFPGIVFVGASSNPTARWVPTFDILGRVSYPVYVLHMPMLAYYQAMWKRVFGHDLILDTPWSGVVYALLLIALSIFLERIYDAPVRAFLRRKLTAGRVRMQEATPVS